MNHLAPRSQWLAITVLAAVIFATLLARSHQKHLPLPAVAPSPVIFAIEGAVKKPGVYLLEEPEVTISRAIELAGGIENNGSQIVPESLAWRSIANGQLIRLTTPEKGPVAIGVEPMPAAARLTLGEKLNVNTSSEADLMLVPQMKVGYAAAIVNRRKNKPWQSLEELMEIPGVGPKTIERWRNYLIGEENETKR